MNINEYDQFSKKKKILALIS